MERRANMNKKNWISIKVQVVEFESDDIIRTSSVSVLPGENETPILPIQVSGEFD